MMLFLTCAALLTVLAVRSCAQSSILPPKKAMLLNGQWANHFESLFDKHLYFYESATTLWGITNYTLFKEGQSGVLIGEEGWLYTDEEFALTRDYEQNFQDNLNYIGSVKDTLTAQNIALIIALLPAKARLYEEHLGRYNYPKAQHDLYFSALEKLQKQNILSINIFDAMKRQKPSEELFLRSDTHWSPAGSKITAQSIAQSITQNMPGLLERDEPYTSTKTGHPLEHKGDLLRYIPLGPWEKYGPTPDHVQRWSTQKIKDAPAPLSSESLFGDETVPAITLIGTSYSANPLWHFEWFLKEALRHDVLNAADEGLGPFEVMENYLANEAFKTAPPKLIIWEIPERYLPIARNKKDLK